jgi:hypothetical protein
MDKRTFIAVAIGAAVLILVIIAAVRSADPFRDMDEKKLEDSIRFMDNLNKRSGDFSNTNVAR